MQPHEFDTPASGDKEPPEYTDSREYYDDQNKDDPNGLWGSWRQDPLGLPKGVKYRDAAGSRTQSLAALERQRRQQDELRPRGKGRDQGKVEEGDGGRIINTRSGGARANGFGSGCGEGGCGGFGSVQSLRADGAADEAAAEAEASRRGLGGVPLRAERMDVNSGRGSGHPTAAKKRGRGWIGLERDDTDRSAYGGRERDRDVGGDARQDVRGGSGRGRRQVSTLMREATAPDTVQGAKPPLADLSQVRADDRLHRDVGGKVGGIVAGEKVSLVCFLCVSNPAP